MRALLLALVACGPKAAPTPAAAPEIPEDAPIPRQGGPVAGPHAVVDRAPPPPVPADLPGPGVLHPWLSAVRKDVTPAIDACRAEGPALAVPQPTLVVATIAADGAVLTLETKRPSGEPAWDACVARGFAGARVTAPPPELVDAAGQVVTPELAFR